MDSLFPNSIALNPDESQYLDSDKSRTTELILFLFRLVKASLSSGAFKAVILAAFETTVAFNFYSCI